MCRDRTFLPTSLMLAATAFLWGSSAIVTTTQAVAVPAALSVGYRMFIACAAMAALAAVRGERLVPTRADAPLVALQGVLFFGLNFIAFYEATRLVPSGVAALVLSSSSIFAGLAARLLLGTPLSRRALLGLACGVAGLAVMVAPEIAALRNGGSETLAGLAFAFVAAASTALGTVAGARNQARGVPMLATMTGGALAGGLFAVGWAAATADFSFAFWDPAPSYLAGLLYLALAATCLAFLIYFALVRRLGPGRAAYALALTPLVALAFSAGLEGLVLTPVVGIGAATILAGNVLVLAGGSRRPARDGGT